jgi:hypothetical protein
MFVHGVLVLVTLSRYLQFADSRPTGSLEDVLRIQPRLAFDMTPGPQYAVTFPVPPRLWIKRQSTSDTASSEELGYCLDSTNHYTSLG